jgi:hypothetical protein
VLQYVPATKGDLLQSSINHTDLHNIAFMYCSHKPGPTTGVVMALCRCMLRPAAAGAHSTAGMHLVRAVGWMLLRAVLHILSYICALCAEVEAFKVISTHRCSVGCGVQHGERTPNTRHAAKVGASR